MVWDLSEPELFILEILMKSRCFKQSSGYNSKKLAHLFRLKFHDSPKRSIRILLNQNYIRQVSKKDIKYYICDLKAAAIALEAHGIPISRGRRRPL